MDDIADGEIQRGAKRNRNETRRREHLHPSQSRRRIRPICDGPNKRNWLGLTARATGERSPPTARKAAMFRFATLLRLSGLALMAGLVFTAVALAQQAPLVGIDPIRAALDQIETTAKRGGLGVRALSDLSQQLPPMRDTLRDKLAELEPRLADLDARLKGLGAAPAKDAPPEDATIATERTRLTQQRAEMDAAIKQVQLLQTRAAQLSDALSARQTYT